MQPLCPYHLSYFTQFGNTMTLRTPDLCCNTTPLNNLAHLFSSSKFLRLPNIPCPIPYFAAKMLDL